ncbi:polysaccharide biosynthesis/export family protein [Gilvimarinus sp. SDUM040013]|uniref:Polysaccharide biosynthesis/export family protein n=1 Tax=Gilvimarinus gilvus TaxID=3058038 RepID=A0ABU4RTL2_9GAMM|nr:polysaccharide biosynthesis/export family protein [Gilvimarinus sp. SDUM040013]MDO3386840.1 polysaccharide biosynthesis/export family protein [Gilvimarinus sp. SDUM040013]MDX6848230.1 polysaccharide biosynthesis/export family protein [Gilvimarinus sp. SDUM040013]
MAGMIKLATKVCFLWVAFAALVGCASSYEDDFPADANKDGNFDYTDVIDHTKGRPGEQLATLEIGSDFPVFQNYFISPGDTLDVVYHLVRSQKEHYPITLYHTVSVQFVNLSKLDQSQDVLPDGTISLPYLGSYSVIGKTVEQVRSELNEKYKKYIRDPEIFVQIKNFNARVEQLRKDLHTAGRGLSKLIKVRPDGYATFPMIGDYYVARRSVEEVYKELGRDYQEYMPGLQVDLFMHEQTGTNVYLLGEVEDPGSYKVVRPISVVQAVARAGGYTRQAETRNVVVFRREGDRLHAHRFNIKDMETFGAQATNFYLQPEDILLVPRTRISSAAQLMNEISDIFLLRGLGLTIGYDINDTRIKDDRSND